jgi:hypothetical protein
MLHHALPRVLIAALAFAVAFDAGAAGTAPSSDKGSHNRYKWHDAAGNLQYTDALPPEAAKLGYEIVSPQGIVIKRVDRAKTAAEMKEAKAAAQVAEGEKNETDAHARADSLLISGYPEESDLERTQHQKLDVLDQQIVAAQISLRSQEQILADMLGRAAEEERAKRDVPEAQLKQVAKMRKQVDDQRLAVARRQVDRETALAGFRDETARYRELKAKLAERKTEE